MNFLTIKSEFSQRGLIFFTENTSKIQKIYKEYEQNLTRLKILSQVKLEVDQKLRQVKLRKYQLVTLGFGCQNQINSILFRSLTSN